MTARGRGWVAVLVAVGLLIALFVLRPFGANDTASPTVSFAPSPPVRYRVEVVARYPHDPNAFLEGLVVAPNGTLFESTGIEGRSGVRRETIETGEVAATRPLAGDYFGEGLAFVPSAAGGELIQLTWKSEVAFRWSATDFAPIGSFHYSGEGWGLAYDAANDRLVMSDGSSQLTFRDPKTFEIEGSVTVVDDVGPVDQLNELEVIDGEVWANVWKTDRIVRVDPTTGAVRGTVDASGLLSPAEAEKADVLNGIAQTPDGRILVSGKFWPALFEVRVLRAK